MEFLAKWINPIFAAFTWALVLILIKPQRIRELLPIGIIAGIILFVVQLILISLSLIQFNKGWILVSGVPLLNPLWGAAAGILVMNYMKEEFSKKIPILFFFSIIAEISAYIAVKVGNLSFLGNYNFLFDFITNFTTLLLFSYLSEGLFGKRIYGNHVK